MSDKVFIDSNVFIYATLESDDIRCKKAQQFLKDVSSQSYTVISTQVLKEYANVLVRKTEWSAQEIRAALDRLKTDAVIPIHAELIKRGVSISRNKQLSYYDSLIIATALEANCVKLYTEDLNNGQGIEGLEIVNPFKS